MIIKAKRIVTASGHRRLADHVFYGKENEEILVLGGGEHILEDGATDARLADTKYCLRHYIISPAEGTTREQVHEVVARLAAEFGFDEADVALVEHKKQRERGQGFERHWHAIVPELRRDGRVLDWHHSYARHEKVARQSESAFGHAPVVGRHNLAVISALQADDPALAARLAPLAEVERPNAAFGEVEQQIAKRTGARPPSEVKRLVRSAWERSDTGPALRAALADLGFELAEGDKPGTQIIKENGQFCGSLSRMAGVRKADIIDRLATPAKPATTPTKDSQNGRDAGQRIPEPAARSVADASPPAPEDRAGRRTPPTVAEAVGGGRGREPHHDAAGVRGGSPGATRRAPPAFGAGRAALDDAKLRRSASALGVAEAVAKVGEQLAAARRHAFAGPLTQAQAEALLRRRIASIDAGLQVRQPTVPTRKQLVDEPVAVFLKTARGLDRVAKAAAADLGRHERSAGLLSRFRPSWRQERQRLAERASVTADAARRAHLVAQAERKHLTAIFPARRDAAAAVRRQSDERRDSMRADRVAFVSALERVRRGDQVAIAVVQQALASTDAAGTLKRGFTPSRLPVAARQVPAPKPEPDRDDAEELGLRHTQKYVPSWAHGPKKADKKQQEKR